MAWLDEAKKDEPSEWEALLQETGRKNDKDHSSRTLVCLGDGRAGKRTLLAKLSGKEAEDEVLGGNGLSYSFMKVNTDEGDADENVSMLNLWAMPAVEKGDLLGFAINKDTVDGLMVVFAVDLSKPHTIEASLKKWSAMLEAHLEQVFSQKEELVEECRARLKHAFQLYSEPEEGAEAKKLSAEDQAMKLEIAVPEGVLTHNLGVRTLVCACKADSLEQQETAQTLSSEQIDYIQAYLRRFCLRYGAALIYTSQSSPENYDILREYVFHASFGMDLRRKAQILDKSNVFVPWGWDSERRITDTVSAPDQPYFVMVPDPDDSSSANNPFNKRSGGASSEPTIDAEDDQEFLKVQKEELEKVARSGGGVAAPPQSSSDKPSALTDALGSSTGRKPSSAHGAGAAAGRRSSAVSGDKTKTPSKGEGGAPPSDEALVNFFHSLLNRDRGAAPAAASAKRPSLVAKPKEGEK